MTFTHLDAVVGEIELLTTRFATAGHDLHLVGGIVRDLWLDRPLGDELDLDLTTDATPDQIQETIGDIVGALWTQGARFGTIGATLGDRHVEITTYRAEVYTPESRKPEVTFGDDIVVDLSRRDFTVNAMALDTHTGELVDPHGGADDLAAKRLRTPLDPLVSFNDDPLRMLRAARFANNYDLAPDADLLAAATELKSRLDIVAPERIRDEFEKLLSAAGLAVGLELLAHTELLGQVITGLTGDVADRAVAIAVGVQGDAATWWLRLAGLVWPLEGSADEPNPDEPAAACRRMRCSNDTIKQIVKVTNGCRTIRSNPHPSNGDVRRWVDALSLSGSSALDDHAFCLANAIGLDTGFEQAYRALAASEDLTDLTIPIDGPTLMTALDIEPGPELGRILKAVRAHRLEYGPIERATAIDLARAASTID